MHTRASEGRLGRSLVLDELLDLTLYRRLAASAAGETADMLRELIAVETRHLAFWQDFFKVPPVTLDPGRRMKLWCCLFLAWVFGETGIHLVLEAIEVNGIRKYLLVWERYRGTALGEAVRGILEDEFKHEDEIIASAAARRIHPERIRDVFLGFNDGLVEILGAVAGFFAALQSAPLVAAAGVTVAVAGSLSMAASGFASVSSARELEDIDRGKRQFLHEEPAAKSQVRPLLSAAIVGTSYFVGALVPVVPVLFGVGNLFFIIAAAATVVVVVSYLLAFLSGMAPRRRIGVNLAVIVLAVAVTYSIGLGAKAFFGVGI